ncbi:MAG: hypothetical protein ACTSU3_11000, partial [Candidatus Thorarchaeota archaeon]
LISYFSVCGWYNRNTSFGVSRKLLIEGTSTRLKCNPNRIEEHFYIEKPNCHKRARYTSIL